MAVKELFLSFCYLVIKSHSQKSRTLLAIWTARQQHPFSPVVTSHHLLQVNSNGDNTRWIQQSWVSRLQPSFQYNGQGKALPKTSSINLAV